jgi:histidine triad (HIT) family protein
MECLFCKIVNKEMEADIVYEDDRCVVIRDINPQAPVHLLVLPKDHIPSLREAKQEHRDTLGYLLNIASDIALKQGLDEGFRVVINDGARAGQSIFHLHIHLLGGRVMKWPPG